MIQIILAIAFCCAAVFFYGMTKPSNKNIVASAPQKTTPQKQEYQQENHKLIDINTDGIINDLKLDNNDFNLSAMEIYDIYGENYRVYKYEFDNALPDFRMESDNIAVYCGDTVIGHIKKGSVSHVRNLINSNSIKKISVDMYGGDYKEVYEDDDGKIILNYETANIKATLHIFT